MKSLPRFADSTGFSYTGELRKRVSEYPALQWFGTKHLSSNDMKALVEIFGSSALAAVSSLEHNAQTEEMLVHLLRAKDCAVRSFVYANPKMSPIREDTALEKAEKEIIAKAREMALKAKFSGKSLYPLCPELEFDGTCPTPKKVEII
jgi:hypothetical protein